MFPAKVPKDDNQFITLLTDSLISQGIQITPFNWKTSLFSRYNLLHLHWPESLTRGRNPFVSYIKKFLLFLLLIRLKFMRIPVVITVHNLEPHEKKNALDRKFDKFLIPKNATKIYMQNGFPLKDQHFFIPHGNYDRLFHNLQGLTSKVKFYRYICFGYLRPYKNIEELIRFFPGELQSLLIAGQPISASYGRSLEACLKNRISTSGISLELNLLSETRLLNLIISADIAIFPHKNIYNSGSVLLALSAPIPIIVTDSLSMRELQREVGAEWLQIIPVEFDGADLHDAVKILESFHRFRGQRSPLSSERNWDVIAQKYLHVYKSLL